LNMRIMPSNNNVWLSDDPVVSVIIPARNEELNIANCLDSIVRQTGIPFEIIVSDDDSSDRTADIAHAFEHVRLVQPGPLPPGWTGKSHALASAVRYARGEWFLFTDADTIHENHSIRTGIQEAQLHQAALVSYSPYQILGSISERMIQPIVFSELSAAFDYAEVNDPKSTIAAGNGQYMLFRKGAYWEIGGHESVRNDLLEDVALAKRVKNNGSRIWFRYAPDVLSARMYRNLREVWSGWSKNVLLLFNFPVKLAAVRCAEGGGFALALLGVFYGLLSQRILIAAVASLVAAIVWRRVRPRFARAGFGSKECLQGLLGLPLFSAILMNAYLKAKFGKPTSWKGRAYKV
jgi:cellulose synthase/poly-beta-1,6-N-acetylglucosamine synthase-like glycosyltransferase